MRRTRRNVVGGLAITASLLLSACGSSSDDKAAAPPENAPRVGGTLVDLNTFSSGEPDFIDPALATGVETTQFADSVFDGLTVIDDEGNVKKAVASDYSSNADATVWTFKLRDDVKFSDGAPVLPSSFKRGWERVLDPKLESGAAYRLTEFQTEEDATTLPNVVADDANRTLTVTLNQADQDLPSLVSSVTFSPVPESATNDGKWEQGVMIGNGPFAMNGPWVHNEVIKVTRNPTYYGGPDNHPAYLDAIEFRISASSEAAYNDFAAGNGQVGYFPGAATTDLQKFQAENIINNPTIGTEFWGFNMANPVVGGPENLKLREAISLAVDKADVNQVGYGGGHEIADSFASPTTPGGEAKSGDGKPNVDAAKAALAEWGKTPPAIRVSYNTGGNHERKAESIVKSLNAVGIPAVADGKELGEYRQAVGEGTLEFLRFAWIADYPSYKALLVPLFASSAAGTDNLLQYSNADVDGLFAKAQVEPSAEKRNELYRDAETKILADHVVVPLNWTTANFIKAPEVKDLKSDPLGNINYSNVWMSV